MYPFIILTKWILIVKLLLYLIKHYNKYLLRHEHIELIILLKPWPLLINTLDFDPDKCNEGLFISPSFIIFLSSLKLEMVTF